MSNPKGTKPAGDVYSLAELCRAEKRLGAPYDVIKAALVESGVKTATFTEAKKIVDAFRTRVVK